MKHPVLVISLSLFLFLIKTGPVIALQSSSGPVSQQSATVSSQSEKVKKQVEKVGSGKDATVIMSDEREFYGSIKSIESDGFLLYDVDIKQLLTIKYDEVKKVRKGYGGKNYATGKRVNPSKAWIGRILGAAAIIIPVTIVLVSLSREK